MNKLIKQLASEAGFKQQPSGLSPIKDGLDVEPQLTKFAQLIIDHCIKICDETENEYLANDELHDNEKFAVGAGVCCNRIKQDFDYE